MALNRWISKAAKVAQVNTVTPASVGIGNTFTLTINSKTVTYTAAAGTVADVTAGVPPLWNGANEGEMNEATAADGTTAVVITANDPGVPFTQTSSASGGTATFTTSTTTANVSPNDANNALNWTDGVPTASDDLVFDSGDSEQGVWWNLDSFSAVTVGTITRRRAFTGRIGLDEYNEDGVTYFEYRPTELACGCTTMLIEQPSSDGPGHIKFNAGSVQTALTILGEGATDFGDERMWWRGTNAANVVNVVNGSLAVGIKAVATSLATIATLRAEESTVRCGSSTTLTTVTNIDSKMEFNSNVTTYTQRGDSAECWVKGTAAFTTANVLEGTLIWQSSGTITTLTPGPGATIDFSKGTGPVTVTNAVTVHTGTTILDPEGRVTWSGGITLATGTRIADVSIDVGTARSLAIS